MIRVGPGWFRTFVLRGVNVVAQYWLFPAEDRGHRKLNMIALVNNEPGVPFVRSARSRPGVATEISLALVDARVSMRQTVANMRPSGVVRQSGARTRGEMLLASRNVVYLLIRKLGMRVGLHDYNVNNNVYVCRLGFEVNLTVLNAKLGPESAYVTAGPHKFPMVRFPSKAACPDHSCRASISQFGKIVFVAALSTDIVVRLLNRIVPLAYESRAGAATTELSASSSAALLARRESAMRLAMRADLLGLPGPPSAAPSGSDAPPPRGSDAPPSHRDIESARAHRRLALTEGEDTGAEPPEPKRARFVAKRRRLTSRELR